MRQFCIASGFLVVSCLIAGCDGGDASTVTPDQAKAAVDATAKWREGHSKPASGSAGPMSPADIARKKH